MSVGGLIMDHYDYVIVGAGSAGCVLAGRLTQDPAVRVLVLEAGPSDKKMEVRLPAAFPKLFKTERDWNYSTAPQKELDGRELYWPRGRMLGGCSSINAQMYVRGNPGRLRRLGRAGQPRLGVGRRAALLPPVRAQRSGRRRAPRGRRAPVRRAAPRSEPPDPRCGRRRRAGRDRPHRRRERARAGGRRPVRGHPAPRPALERGRCLPASGAQATEPLGEDGRAGHQGRSSTPAAPSASSTATPRVCTRPWPSARSC